MTRTQRIMLLTGLSPATVLAGKLESEQSHSAALAALLARLNLVAGSEGEGGEPSA